MALKMQIVVRAGIFPGIEVQDYRRVWQLTSEEATNGDRFREAITDAHEYAKSITAPQYVNWVQTDWMWM
jgi:hypothetical protein